LCAPCLVQHLPRMGPWRRTGGWQVAGNGGVASDTQTPWLACHQPLKGGRQRGGGSVGWLLTDLHPPRAGRGDHPHHWGWVGRQQVARLAGLGANSAGLGAHIYTVIAHVNPAPLLSIVPLPPYLSIPVTLPPSYLLGEPAFLIVTLIPIHSCP
jgi:hypothetical protein